MGTNSKQLVFVYNADSGIVNGLFDWTHKILSPQTYQCQLCSLTTGTFGEKSDWKQFIENLPLKVEFLHKDQFAREITSLEIDFPVIFMREKGRLSVFLSKTEIDKCITLHDLTKLINARLETES
ncbi:MAG: hypothetical protein ACOCXP_03790 [Candidatus Dojkabacteria bacterium]